MASNNGRDFGKNNLKSVCVIQRGTKYYFPPTIPKERGPLSKNIILLASLVLFIANTILSDNNLLSIVALYSFGLLVAFFLQISHRIILVVEETNHLTSRYKEDVKNLLHNAFHFPSKVWIALVVSVIYTVYYTSTNNISDVDVSLKNLVFLVPSIYFLSVRLELEASPLNDSLWIAKDNGLDYGSGMAYSFFHGYLKLVLPKTGTEEKNLKELMQDYEDRNQIKFSAYKLFILIPKSLNCFTSLMNEHSPSVEESNSLSEKIKTVAGVKDRVYKNAVYKINPGRNEEKIYVSAEFATPLKTFKEVVNQTGIHTEFYDTHKNDITLQFYLTLKNVLEQTGMSEFCELIFYEDYPQDDEANNRSYYDVGKIILTRLKELKKNQ